MLSCLYSLQHQWPMPRQQLTLTQYGWIERYNKKLREAAKKEDARRLKSFVGAAEACDPRILARAQEQKAER